MTAATRAVSTRWADLPPLYEIPALTVRQPWVAAILAGVKTVENRSWPPRRLTHWWLWLHEGAAADRSGRQFVTDRGYPELAGVKPARGIVAAIRLGGTLCALPPEYCRCGPWAFPDALHWPIVEVLPLPERVPCNGQQQLWYPNRDVLDQIRAMASTT